MLKIRKEQSEIFSQAAIKSFEDRMIQYLRQFFSQRYDEFGEEHVRGLIREGIANAATYQIIRECDVARYVTIMFSLRTDFDTSHETAWAAPILRDTSRTAEDRLEQLYSRTIQELEKVRERA